MRCVTAVDGEWLAELGPMFYSLKESYAERLARKKAQALELQSMEKQMELALEKEREEKERAKAEKEKLLESSRKVSSTVVEIGAQSIKEVLKQKKKKRGFGI
jgi:pre-mRNA-splicing factor ATP-dependent RNA helicase DHX38/PRP16